MFTESRLDIALFTVVVIGLVLLNALSSIHGGSHPTFAGAMTILLLALGLYWAALLDVAPVLAVVMLTFIVPLLIVCAVTTIQQIWILVA